MLGKTQEWLANQAKITPAVVIGLESAKRKLPDNHALSQVKGVLEANGLELLEAAEARGEGVRWTEPTNKTWVECLRHGRAMLGISLDEMAARSGVGKYAIARLERGNQKRLPEQSAERLRDVLFENGVIILPEDRSHGAGVCMRSKHR
ncbi:hypothetical protein ATY75_21280 [Rhizobium sp. N122]|uniref:helix-turn-helix domain-containing protein n=1 Tax=Rhizobium sp. N122 TaxID=1764272 RepID=UPI000B5A685A|nr:helix-turn-helix transcriptional regulator [Rhizobium sp. N122]OWV87892.1 hypothetical protein ATY75_21280 [Rhizobium sp. N122]